MTPLRWSAQARHRRFRRALERQLDFQVAKAQRFRGAEAEAGERMNRRSTDVHRLLSGLAALPQRARVLEVGSGSGGLIYHFPSAGLRVGIDPLAVAYRSLFPSWSGRAAMCSALGEDLPFRDAMFDAVLCDNVVDHAEKPDAIVQELARVLRPGGVLYFTVNTHHPIYAWASVLHGLWNAAGWQMEITPFADHTVHLTPAGARAILIATRLRLLWEQCDPEAARAAARRDPSRHPGDLLKRLFFKNARYLAVATKPLPTLADPADERSQRHLISDRDRSTGAIS
jgi:SAM-dependent methyltransferase